MSIPPYQYFMTPALKALGDKKLKSVKSVEEIVVKSLSINKEDLEQLLPSGTQTIVRNRTNWALYYMFRAGLLDREKRGFYKITDLGLKALNENVEINNSYLEKFDSFNEFRNGEDVKEKIDVNNELSPNEQINSALDSINNKLQNDILEKIRNVDDVYFERIILDLLVKMGYGGNREDAAEMTKKSHDGGIDGIIKEDPLGISKIYMQAKKYTNEKVHSKEMRYFLGSLRENNSSKGIFVTASDFDPKAIEMASKGNIILINGKQLAKLMLQYNIGVINKQTIEIKEINLSYFDDEQSFC